MRLKTSRGLRARSSWIVGVSLRIERDDADVVLLLFQRSQHMLFHRSTLDDEASCVVALADFLVDEHGDVAARAFPIASHARFYVTIGA